MPGPASSFDTYKSDIMNRPADKRAAAAERHLDLLTQMRSSLQQEFITRLEGTHRIMGNSRSYQSILDTLKAIESIMDTSITVQETARTAKIFFILPSFSVRAKRAAFSLQPFLPPNH